MGQNEVFVTVGTTRFDKLVNLMFIDEVLNALRDEGYKKLTVQIGSSEYVKVPKRDDLEIIVYRYKESLSKDIESASLVITHAGAGSILESLSASKTVIAVINDDLMDNHQSELAEILAEQNYLIATFCKNLRDVIKEIKSKAFSSFPKGETHKFWSCIDDLFLIN